MEAAVFASDSDRHQPMLVCPAVVLAELTRLGYCSFHAFCPAIIICSSMLCHLTMFAFLLCKACKRLLGLYKLLLCCVMCCCNCRCRFPACCLLDVVSLVSSLQTSAAADLPYAQHRNMLWMAHCRQSLLPLPTIWVIRQTTPTLLSILAEERTIYIDWVVCVVSIIVHIGSCCVWVELVMVAHACACVSCQLFGCIALHGLC